MKKSEDKRPIYPLRWDLVCVGGGGGVRLWGQRWPTHQHHSTSTQFIISISYLHKSKIFGYLPIVSQSGWIMKNIWCQRWLTHQHHSPTPLTNTTGPPRAGYNSSKANIVLGWIIKNIWRQNKG